jgi:adenosine deaminase
LQELIADFAEDNVRYMEIRTTPRAFQGSSIHDYCAAVINVLVACEKRWPTITVRLIISVDRSGTPEAAMDIVKLAASLQESSKWVVGVDFGGNPHKNSFVDFLPAFHFAREHQLKSTVHIGEIVYHEDTSAILEFMPDRLGHALELEDDPKFIGAIMRGRTPVEICPTSNLFTLQLSSYEEHPTLNRWLENGHPIAISTDDCGIFNTTLSEEFMHVANAFGLSRERLCQVSIDAAKHVFAEHEVCEELVSQLSMECQELLRGAADHGRCARL